jgi:fructose-1,6-bisphosphatase/inositol monophosphatase family enzyme
MLASSTSSPSRTPSASPPRGRWSSPSTLRRAADDRSGWQQLAGAVRRISCGGDCYAYGLLALEQIDIVAEGDMKLWDWAALVPVIEGAGGRVTSWNGAPLRPEGPPDRPGRVLAVGDPALLPQAVTRLAGQPPLPHGLGALP